MNNANVFQHWYYMQWNANVSPVMVPTANIFYEYNIDIIWDIVVPEISQLQLHYSFIVKPIIIMRSNIGLLLLVYFQKRVLNSSIRVCVVREFVLYMNVKIAFYSGKFDTYCFLIQLFFINSSFNRLLYYKHKIKYEIINKNHNKIITNLGASSH